MHHAKIPPAETGGIPFVGEMSDQKKNSTRPKSLFMPVFPSGSAE